MREIDAESDQRKRKDRQSCLSQCLFYAGIKTINNIWESQNTPCYDSNLNFSQRYHSDKHYSPLNMVHYCHRKLM